MPRSSRSSHARQGSVRSLSISRPLSQGSSNSLDLLPASGGLPSSSTAASLSYHPPLNSPAYLPFADTPTIPEDYHHHPLQSPARTSFDTTPDLYATFELESTSSIIFPPQLTSSDAPTPLPTIQVDVPISSATSFPSLPLFTTTPIPVQKNAAPPATLPPSPTVNHAPPETVWLPAQPTVRLLFSYLTMRDHLLLTTPAGVIAILSGLLTPYMTLVVGDSFDAFSKYPLVPGAATDAQDHQLLHDIQLASIKLAAMGFGFLVLHTIMSGLWIWIGEVNVRAIRKEVFDRVGSREMEWFDLGMGLGDGGEEIQEDKEEGVGAAGLMSKFTR